MKTSVEGVGARPLLEIGFKKATALGMAVSGAAVAGFAVRAGVLAAKHASIGRWVLCAGLGLGALLLVVGAIAALLRRRPVLSATETGIELSLLGSDLSFVPWEQVARIEVVGRGSDRHLVITVLEPETAAAGVQSAVRSEAKRLAKKFNLPVGLSVHQGTLALPIDDAARLLREVGLERLERGAV